jgi:predicted nuclease of predicted toxin-antitoxin system
VRFLIDAQLPPRLATFLTTRGHEAVHVESLPSNVLTPDAEISG